MPANAIAATALRTYHQAAGTAFQTFGQAISNAAQTSVKNGTALDSGAVSSAITALQGSLDAAVGNLGLPATPNTSDLTTAIDNLLTGSTGLLTTLTGITAPAANNTASARLFLRTVAVDVAQTASKIEQAVQTAVQSYDNSLL